MQWRLKVLTAFLAVLPGVIKSVPVSPESDTSLVDITAQKKIGELEPAEFSPHVSPMNTRSASAVDYFEFFDVMDHPDVLRRLKRDLYERDQYGRILERDPYYRRRGNNRRTGSHYNRRTHRRTGRQNVRRTHRRKPHIYIGPGNADDSEGTQPLLTNAGHVDTSDFDGTPKPNNNFVSARSSGVARTETSGSSI